RIELSHYRSRLDGVIASLAEAAHLCESSPLKCKLPLIEWPKVVDPVRIRQSPVEVWDVLWNEQERTGLGRFFDYLKKKYPTLESSWETFSMVMAAALDDHIY